jgi:hypothetical protein
MNDDIFDPQTVEDPNLIPEGTYDLVIENATFESNRKGTGKLVTLVTHIVNNSQDLDGRKLRVTINLVHDTPKAQQIGRAQFKQLLTAIGHGGTFNLSTDFPSLKGKSFSAFVKIEEGYNRVKNFKAVDNMPF